MSASFYELLKHAKTGISSPSMTGYDKLKALAMAGGIPVSTLSGIPPISFKSDGTPLTAWSISGAMTQTGTPTPDAPIMPEFVGTLDNTDWKIPITCAGQTAPVYLGQVSTVRRVKKLVLTGEENWSKSTSADNTYLVSYTYLGIDAPYEKSISYCTHAVIETLLRNIENGEYILGQSSLYFRNDSISTKDDFKAWLASEYAAGHPVTIWYVLAEPETGIVNDPLAKIGDYADELNSTDAAVTIPTVKGQNTLTVDTDLQPSEVSITGHIKN